MKEQWKDIKDWEGFYKISNKGRVKSLTRAVNFKNGTKMVYGRILKLLLVGICGRKYFMINLCGGKRSKFYKIARLVALHFIPNPKNKPTVNHKDGIKTNDDVNNLEWTTYSENIKHAYRIGLKTNKGNKHPNHKLNESEVLQIRKLFPNNMGYTQTDIAEIYGVTKQNISYIIRGKGWVHLIPLKQS